MARIRSIKPEFFTSRKIARLPVTARLTFIGLWTHVDDEGRAPDEPRLIKAALWPLDDKHTVAKVEADLKILEKEGRIVRYTSSGERYLAVVGWGHQRIDKARNSDYPAPPETGAIHEPSTNETGTGQEGSVASRAPADRIIGSDRIGVPLSAAAPSAEPAEPEPPPNGLPAIRSPEVPGWQAALRSELAKVDQTGSWNLVDTYADAWDSLIDRHRAHPADLDPWPDLIGLTCGFVAQVVGEPPAGDERKLIAMTVRKHGKAALLGWDRALGSTETDSPRDRFRYARGVINRFIAELEPAR